MPEQITHGNDLCDCGHLRREHGSAWMDPEPRTGKCLKLGCYCTRFLIARVPPRGVSPASPGGLENE